MRGGLFVASASVLVLRAVAGRAITSRRLRHSGIDSIVEIQHPPVGNIKLDATLEEKENSRQLIGGFMEDAKHGEKDVVADMVRLLQTTFDSSMSMSMSMPTIVTSAPTGSSTSATLPPTNAPILTLAPTYSLEPTPTPGSGQEPMPTELSPAPTVPLAPSGVTTPSPTTMVVSRDEEIIAKCGVTAIERSRDILTILSGISDPMKLVTPSSPQFKARSWLDNVDPAIICASSSEHIEQRYRMALLYNQLGGPDWYNCRAAIDSGMDDLCIVEDVRSSRQLQKMMQERSSNTGDAAEAISNYHATRSRGLQTDAPSDGSWSEQEAIRWLDGSNECDWFGLDCGSRYQERGGGSTDDYYPVIKIDLGTNNLSGPFTEEILEFQDLEGYFLDGNMNITGTIPDVLDKMPKLQYLDFDGNELGGSIPSSLYKLSDLIAIDLNANQLEGTLSEAIGSIRNLEVLQLENNNMSGPLPSDSLLKLERLVALTLEGNLFTGTLEPLCDVRDERRLEYEIYLQFMFTECGGDNPLVTCTCCVCK